MQLINLWLLYSADGTRDDTHQTWEFGIKFTLNMNCLKLEESSIA